MVSLSADNRTLTQNAKYSYLASSYLSNIGTIVLANSVGFANNDYVLIGEFGLEQSEIVQVATVDTVTHTLTLVANTKFAHSESSKVTIIRYNRVKFYRTTTPAFNSNPVNALGDLNGYDIEADSNFTIYYDHVNSTGYGWFVFWNSTAMTASSNSNAIPYAGFDENSVRNVLENFYSLLNNKEIKLISSADAFRWLNEGYAIAVNELNLVNNNFSVSGAYDVTTAVGTQEYALPVSFSKLLSVRDNTNNLPVAKIEPSEVDAHDANGASDPCYYLRQEGGTWYLGFSPIPTSVLTYKIRYKTKTTRLSSPYDNINLPDNQFYCLVDFMIYRAAPKLNRPDGKVSFDAFTTALQRLKVVSHKQDAGLDSWSIADNANI